MSQSFAITLPQGLPFHYIELATDLCKYAREDLSDWNLSYDLVVRLLCKKSWISSRIFDIFTCRTLFGLCGITKYNQDCEAWTTML